MMHMDLCDLSRLCVQQGEQGVNDDLLDLMYRSI